MGFGKKKKNKKKQEEVINTPKKSVKVDMQHNPLYPPKKESDMQELLMAFGTTVVSIVLVALIFSKFSYANRVNAYGGQGSGYVASQESSPQQDQAENEDQQEIEPEDDMMISEEETGGIMEEEPNEPEESEQVQEENRDYIIAYSNSQYISNSDLEGLSAEELSRARNEIYARHGRKFKDAALQSYFDSKPWYSGTISPDDFSESMLNEYEKKNAETILAYEKSKGYK